MNTDSLRALMTRAGALLSLLARWTGRLVGILVALGPPAALAWYVATAGPAIHDIDGYLLGITTLVGLAAIAAAVSVGWFLVVVWAARAAPLLGGDDHGSERKTTWVPPRRGT